MNRRADWPNNYVGQVIHAALKSNLSISNVIFEEGNLYGYWHTPTAWWQQ